MTQEQLNQRLTAAVVRLGEIMQRAEGGVSVDRSLQELYCAACGHPIDIARISLAAAEERIALLAESLPPDARCADAALLENVKAEVLTRDETNEMNGPPGKTIKERINRRRPPRAPKI